MGEGKELRLDKKNHVIPIFLSPSTSLNPSVMSVLYIRKKKNILKIMRIQKLEPRSSHPSGSCREVMVAPREMQVSFTPFLLVIV